MSSAQTKPTANRARLLNMVGGGSGETQDYIEIIHYITPEGAPNGVGYRAHTFGTHYQTGKPYENLMEWTDIETIEGLLSKTTRNREGYLPLPLRDFGTTETGAPRLGLLKAGE